MSADVVVVLVTAPNSEEAERLASQLVEQRLAACVNVAGPIRSIYEWEGKTEHSEEWLLIAKTSRARFAALRDFVEHHHSYQVPEVLALPVQEGSPPYLAWVLQVLGRNAR